ncbi:uncharacterized protein LOC112089552 isoform X2 [Eutrema salsugineum]|nr:uncharacterized protein LOC112089552 isoform X2 [Eutrema salsugineum]XP_024016143.1 uncharacterized protein LOC112089552 isoform X2 [Eutrema salsugineum]
MLKLIDEGFQFKGEMFLGGCKPAVIPPKSKSRKGKSGKGVGGRSAKNKGRGAGPSTTIFDETRIGNIIEAKLSSYEIALEEKFADMLSKNNKVVIAALKKLITKTAVNHEDIPTRSVSVDNSSADGTVSESSQTTGNGDEDNASNQSAAEGGDAEFGVSIGNQNERLSTEDIIAYYAVNNDENGGTSVLPEQPSSPVVDHQKSGDSTYGGEPTERRTIEGEAIDSQPLNRSKTPMGDGSNLPGEKYEGDKDQMEVVDENEPTNRSTPAPVVEEDVHSNVAHQANPLGQHVPVASPIPDDDCPEAITRSQINVADAPGGDENIVNNPDANHNEVTRKSKRPRMISSRLDERFECGKRLKTRIGHEKESDLDKMRRLDEKVQNAINSVKRAISLGNCISLSARELADLLERKKSPPAKVMDAVLKFSRHMLRKDVEDGVGLRVDILDSKFVSQLTKLYPRFSKCENWEEFRFNRAVVDLLTGKDEPDRVELYAEADIIYLPFNFDQRHWVSLAVDLVEKKIGVLDCNVSLKPDHRLVSDLQPIATMLPYLFQQVSHNPEMSQINLTPFTIERITGLPQISSTPDAGMCSVFLLQSHALGGVEAARAFYLSSFETELKRFITALVKQYSI